MEKYTQDFIDEVIKLYPDYPKMHELAINGNAFLGRYLDDSGATSIHMDRILLATSLDELQKEARVLKAKRELYNKYWEQPPAKQR